MVISGCFYFFKEKKHVLFEDVYLVFFFFFVYKKASVLFASLYRVVDKTFALPSVFVCVAVYMVVYYANDYVLLHNICA